MTRVGFTVAFVALTLASGEPRGAGGVQGQTVHDTLTFTKDVAPILYRHCASCHHLALRVPCQWHTHGGPPIKRWNTWSS